MNGKMKRILASLMLTATAVSSFSGCAFSPENSAGRKLTNHMTQTELERSAKTEFRLLDKPWETEETPAEKDYSYLNDKICFVPKIGAIVHGNPVFNCLPEEDYDGSAGTAVYHDFDVSTGESTEIELVFGSFEDLKKQLRERFDVLIASGYPAVPANEEYSCVIELYEAVIADEVEIIDQELLDEYMDFYYSQGGNSDSESMYWQMDDSKVAAIKDSINEYHFYDEELNMGFTVHVTVPPAYEAKRSYPALVMTDAVWRFNDVTSLYGEMQSGKADAQILITIGFEYDTDGWDNMVRSSIFCDHKKEFLDFITDNMMPYLGEEYNFDYGRSTLFGHSQGGVFTHYAAFNFDLYENRPFANYIIGSPTFWTPYFTEVPGYEEYLDEYGYFSRNKSYDRNLFITAGDMEDEDYEEYYGDNDSTLEGVEHLKERLTEHGVSTYQVKIYNSHHYQYVPEMLTEYICSMSS
jgi:predicted alpha/beta superfamily hydrolase